MRTILCLIILLVSAQSLAQEIAPGTRAQQVEWTITCASHRDVFDFVAEYEEQPIVLGTMGQRGRMAFLINDKTGSWTLLAYTHQGACIMASGNDARQLQPTDRKPQ